MVHQGIMKRLETYFFALFIYLGFIPTALAERDILAQFSHFHDATGQLSISQIIEPQRAAAFRPKSAQQLGVWSPKGQYWLKGQLEAVEGQSLIFTQANLQQFELYEVRGDGAIITHANPQQTAHGQVFKAVEGEVFLKLSAPYISGRLILEEDRVWADAMASKDRTWQFAMVTLIAGLVLASVFLSRKGWRENWRVPLALSGAVLMAFMASPLVAAFSIYVLWGGFAIGLVLATALVWPHQKAQLPAQEPFWSDLQASLNLVQENLGVGEGDARADCLSKDEILASGDVVLAELRLNSGRSQALMIALDDADKIEDAMGVTGLNRAMDMLYTLIAAQERDGVLIGQYTKDALLLILRWDEGGESSALITQLMEDLPRHALLLQGLRLTLGIRMSSSVLDATCENFAELAEALEESVSVPDEEIPTESESEFPQLYSQLP